jgi:hypothetical protein
MPLNMNSNVSNSRGRPEFSFSEYESRRVLQSAVVGSSREQRTSQRTDTGREIGDVSRPTGDDLLLRSPHSVMSALDMSMSSSNYSQDGVSPEARAVTSSHIFSHSTLHVLPLQARPTARSPDLPVSDIFHETTDYAPIYNRSLRRSSISLETLPLSIFLPEF